MNYFVQPLKTLICELQSAGYDESYEQILHEIWPRRNDPYQSEISSALLKILETQVDTFLEKNKALMLDTTPDSPSQADGDLTNVICSKEFSTFHKDIRENLRAAVDCILRENQEEGQRENDEGSAHSSRNSSDSESTTLGTIQADIASLAATETESIDRISGLSGPLYDSCTVDAPQENRQDSVVVEERSSLTESSANERTRQTSVAESSFSGSMTQEGCTFLSQTELTELARLLDPQHHSTAERTAALRQIVNLPVLDVQACESWMAAASLQTPTQRTSTAAQEQAPASSPIFSLTTTTTGDEVPASVSDPSSMPAYSIRTGILEALNDEDEELWSLAMQFLAKGFATTSANVKECYCVLTEYIEDQFSGNCGPIPKLSAGLDISTPRINRLLRAFCLFNEVNKQITQLWLRYPEKHVLTILDRCLIVLTIGSTSMTLTDVQFAPLTPVHFISLLDPQATWFAKWTKGAYSCRPLLTKLKNNRQFITLCLSICLRFLRAPPCENKCSTESLPQQFVYSGSQVDAAHFLHSLHVLVWLLCLREGRKLFPISLSDQQAACLPKDTVPTQIDNYRKVQVGDLLASLLWFLRIPHMGSGQDTNCRTLASNCLLRLSESPFAHELFCCSSEGSAGFRSRKQKKPEKRATAVVSSSSSSSICLALMEPVNTLLQNLSTGMKFQDIDIHLYDVGCQFTQVLVNLSRSPAGRAFVKRKDVLVDAQQPLLSRISRALCDLLGAVRTTLADQVTLPTQSDIPAKLIVNLSRILCQTCLAPEGMESCAKFAIHMEAIDTWKTINGELETSSDMVEAARSYLSNLQKSLEDYLLCLAATPKGLELLRRRKLLEDCVKCIFIRYDRVIKMQKYERFGCGLLVSQLAASSTGYASLQACGFTGVCVENAWLTVQGLGSLTDTGRQGGVSALGEPVPPLWPVDSMEKFTLKPFNQLANIYSSFAAVLLAITSPQAPSDDEHAAPNSLTGLLDRLLMLDPTKKYSILYRPEEGRIFGLRLLSFIVSSLDAFLLLEARFNLLDLLLEEQAACAIEERSDAYIIDAGLVERNYLLAKCNLIGGPTERYLPPRTLCCHREEPYPFPVISKLPCNLDAFTNPKLRCFREPCISAAEIEMGRVSTSGVKESRSRPQTLLALVSSMVHRNGRRDQTTKLSALNDGIKTLQKALAAMGRSPKTVDAPAIFEACLKGIALRRMTQSDAPPVKDNPSTLPAIEETAIRLIVRYGRRVSAFDQSASVQPTQQAVQATELFRSIDSLLAGERQVQASTSAASPSPPPSPVLSSSSSSCVSLSQQAERRKTTESLAPRLMAELCEPSARDASYSLAQFEGFDWFTATIFLIFGGDSGRAFAFLANFYKSRFAVYLWPARSRSLVKNSGKPEVISPQVAEIPPMYYEICHHMELILAKEVQGVFNTFRLSGHPPSKVFFHWMSQCFWNYLDWPEIVDFQLLCLLCGPEYAAFAGVAILRHLKPVLIDALQSQSHLVRLRDEPITGFRFIDHLEFIESLATKYGSDVSADLNQPMSIN